MLPIATPCITPWKVDSARRRHQRYSYARARHRANLHPGHRFQPVSFSRSDRSASSLVILHDGADSTAGLYVDGESTMKVFLAGTSLLASYGGPAVSVSRLAWNLT